MSGILFLRMGIINIGFLATLHLDMSDSASGQSRRLFLLLSPDSGLKTLHHTLCIHRFREPVPIDWQQGTLALGKR